jgi:predicted NBD/HSP70 family sugar kinase
MPAVALGEKATLSATARTAEYLCAGVINLVNSFYPEVVIIGREFARAAKPIIEPIQCGCDSRISCREKANPSGSGFT